VEEVNQLVVEKGHQQLKKEKKSLDLRTPVMPCKQM